MLIAQNKVHTSRAICTSITMEFNFKSLVLCPPLCDHSMHDNNFRSHTETAGIQGLLSTHNPFSMDTPFCGLSSVLCTSLQI